ncbi:MAG: alanine racemase [Candidatus Marinimicrobia bacterium]|nr:alanine racemase [Candidatus Neomarinimicrobiota bacterium]
MEAICRVSLDAITNNFQYFQDRVLPAQVIPVVKANAYGHGAVEVTQHLHQELGVTLFAVATLEEACQLATAFPQISILIFSRVFAEELIHLPENTILTIGSMEDASMLRNSVHAGIKVHLNVNTGMNRLGLSPDQAMELIADPKFPLAIEGVYSHYSSSDTEKATVFSQQNEMFKNFVMRTRQHGFKGMIHMSNSAGTLHSGQEHYDAVRLGIGLYGYDTTPGQQHQQFLEPVMEVLAPLVRVERIRIGESVSYSEKWRASIDTNIGTLRIGYADGYSRALTNRGMVSFQGKTYPVIGTVTMDHIMIDLGQEFVSSGSLFTVMGGEIPSVQVASIASMLNTITYEICCGISPRVVRKY